MISKRNILLKYLETIEPPLITEDLLIKYQREDI